MFRVFSRYLTRSILTTRIFRPSSHTVKQNITTQKISTVRKDTKMKLKTLFSVVSPDTLLITGTVAWCVFPKQNDLTGDCIFRGIGGFFLSSFLVDMGLTSLGLVCIPVYIVGRMWRTSQNRVKKKLDRKTKTSIKS